MFRLTRSNPRMPAPVRVALLSLSLCTFPLSAQTQTTPDNSANNRPQNQGATADKQTNGQSDVQVAARIRRAVVADKSLSTYGHNVKIVTKNGMVTLKGPVHSDEEKQKIADEAAAVVGHDKVNNQITVKQ